MAWVGQVVTQGGLVSPVVGLHGAQLYLSLWRCSSRTPIILPSSKSNSFGITSNTDAGHISTHFPHPSHLSVSKVMKYSPEPSLYP